MSDFSYYDLDKAVETTETTIQGKRLVTATYHDDLLGNPLEDMDGNGRFIDFTHETGDYVASVAGLDPDESYTEDEFKAALTKAHPYGFIISKTEHGNVRYSREQTSPSGDWDTSTCAGLWLIDKYNEDYFKSLSLNEREAYCDHAMEVFSAWANGETYETCTFIVDEDDQIIDHLSEDEDYTDYGWENAERSRKEMHAGYVDVQLSLVGGRRLTRGQVSQMGRQIADLAANAADNLNAIARVHKAKAAGAFVMEW